MEKNEKNAKITVFMEAHRLPRTAGPRRSVAVRSYPSPKVRGSDRECQAATVQERRRRGASARPRSGAAAERNYLTPEVRGSSERRYPTSKERLLRGRRTAERSYSTFKVRRGGREKIPLLQGKEQRLCFAGTAVKRCPTSKVRETQVRGRC